MNSLIDYREFNLTEKRSDYLIICIFRLYEIGNYDLATENINKNYVRI